MLELGLSGYRRGRVGEKGLGLSQLGLSFARGGRARASRVRSFECKWGFGSSGLLLRGACAASARAAAATPPALLAHPPARVPTV